MKLTTIMAIAFALSSSAALAQAGTSGQSGTSVGSVVAPSVGPYNWPWVGSTLAVPSWTNTSPPAPTTAAPTVGNAPSSPRVRR
jgi:hypothetical protein